MDEDILLKLSRIKSPAYLTNSKRRQLGSKQISTLLITSSIENVTPCSSSKLAFPSMREKSCLFSSQVPLPSFSGDIMQFVEVHQAFLIHCWPHDNKLGESNRLTTYPLSCLFSRVVKYDEREKAEVSLKQNTNVVRTNNTAPLHAIARRSYELHNC